jgi:circadian clock protein KaiB
MRCETGRRGDTVQDADIIGDSERRERQRYVLRLYVAGTTPRSTRAIANIRKICDDELQGRYDLEVIDVYQNPGATEEAEIIAVPTLIKSLPLPLRRLIGDLSDRQKVILGLDLQPKDETA